MTTENELLTVNVVIAATGETLQLFCDEPRSFHDLHVSILKHPTVEAALVPFLEHVPTFQGLPLVHDGDLHFRYTRLLYNGYQVNGKNYLTREKLRQLDAVELLLGTDCVTCRQFFTSERDLLYLQVDYSITFGQLKSKIRRSYPYYMAQYKNWYNSDKFFLVVTFSRTVQSHYCDENFDSDQEEQEEDGDDEDSHSSDDGGTDYDRGKFTIAPDHLPLYRKSIRLGMLIMQPFALSIQTLAGQRFQVGFHEKTKMKHLIQRLREVTGIPRRRISLFHQGQRVNHDSRSVLDHGIPIQGGILYLVDYQSSCKNNSTKPLIGFAIEQTELRAISLQQLKNVTIQIILRCEKEKWTSTSSNQKKEKQRCLLKPEDVTLYDLVQHYIVPITKERKCSYVELIAPGPQKPDWFVSHWWGEPILQFVACLEKHAKDRFPAKRPDQIFYWVCAYANNQHSLDEELYQSTPDESSFFRAMEQSVGTVSILDKDMVVFSRIWCSFEVVVSLRQNEMKTFEDNNDSRYLYDLYTMKDTSDGTRAVGLRDGDCSRGRGFPSFPQALDICIQKAKASVPEDRTMILNYIVGRQQDQAHESPLKQHKAYDEVNAVLRGRFAEATYRLALEQGSVPMEKYRAALAQYPGLVKLWMDFRNCPPFAKEARHFIDSALPQHLHTLSLDLDENVFVKLDDGFANGLSRLVKLASLSLSLRDCWALESLGSLPASLGRCSSVEVLSLDLSNIKVEALDCSWHGSFSQLALLRSFRLRYMHKFHDLTSIRALLEEVGMTTTLKELEFQFRSECDSWVSTPLELSLLRLDQLERLTVHSDNGGDAEPSFMDHLLRLNPRLMTELDIGFPVRGKELSQALAHLVNLSRLKLTYWPTTSPEDSDESVSNLANSLARLNSLKALDLFLRPKREKDILDLCGPMATMSNLTRLKLNVGYDRESLSDDALAEIGAAISQLSKIETFSLTCDWTNLTSLECLLPPVVGLSRLKHFELQMKQCHALSRATILSFAEALSAGLQNGDCVLRLQFSYWMRVEGLARLQKTDLERSYQEFEGTAKDLRLLLASQGN
ncbi:Kinesin light chain [Seminavis robusta]|uniref:Kinesin light chain n=1 Tax=Seminavis robusta TaxID=568900 RepID=A0A9N8HI06_9STRA|nr:Kinesin light chain [Seminavis robusta]|eukprot:Sro669_g184590.1 Kinesin light chain (1066) ;mRNA; r:43044-46327